MLPSRIRLGTVAVIATAAVALTSVQAPGGRVEVRVSTAPTPFTGTDGLIHLAYELQIGQSVDDAARALSLFKAAAQPGTFSSTVGRACLALGQALLAQGKRDDARSALQSAAEHLQSSLGPDHAETISARQLAELNTVPGR